MIRVATRASRLARWQADRVGALLDREYMLEIVDTTGDRRPDVPIAAMGGQGVFVKEVQAAVLEGRADCAVHSAKDLPSATPPGLVLAAVPERSDPYDALVGSTLAALPAGARVGTGAVRRRAQLANLRPDITFGELRGNIDTRLAKAAEFDAIVVAAAALYRMDRADTIAEVLDESVMVPQVAQGAIAVECRADDDATRGALATIDSPYDHTAVRIERAFLAALAARANEAGAASGCDLPCGAHAARTSGGVRVHALLASPDGRVVLRVAHEAPDTATPEAVGSDAAKALLDDAGATMLLGETIA